ncbi:MAG: arginyltransferase [Gammaproteobacteria bacterium]|nr:arginyltransferase [Gammaproteobacteria bacterium]
MTTSNQTDAGHLRLYKTAAHPCSYLPELESQTLFIDPEAEKNILLYQSLIEIGFRRSGSEIYRPDCQDCATCISLRIPVDRFTPRRSQRRVWNQHQSSINVSCLPAEFNSEHFELYSKYINSRHPDGEMTNPTEEDYRKFLITPWCDTNFVEFRTDDRLFSVAVIDMLPHGISAVYTFFDPDMSGLSPGVLAILWQINQAKSLGLPWLYLGYWVQGCKKMEYKQDYRPIQVLSSGIWKEFYSSETITIPELRG